MIHVLVLMMRALVLIAGVRISLGHVHLHLEAMVWLTAVEQRVLTLVMALVEHVEGRRMGARGAIWGRCIVVVEAYPRIIDGRAVTLM